MEPVWMILPPLVYIIPGSDSNVEHLRQISRNEQSRVPAARRSRILLTQNPAAA